MPESLKDEAVVVTRTTMGWGPTELCEKLLRKYLEVQLQEKTVPRYVLLYSEGVKAACRGTDTAELLQKMVEQGCKVLLCSTCIDFFHLERSELVGTPSCMTDISQAMHSVQKLIWL